MEAKQWSVQIHISESDAETRAEAVLTTRGSSRLVGRGTAHRNPIDRSVPEIGDELAVSRALEDLAIKVHDVASEDIANLTGPAPSA